MLNKLILGSAFVQNPFMTAMHYRIIMTFSLFIFIALVTYFVSNKIKRSEKFEREVDQLIREEQLMFREAKQDIRKIADREARKTADLEKSIEYYKRKIIEVDLLEAKKSEMASSNHSQNGSNRPQNGSNRNNGNRNNGSNHKNGSNRNNGNRNNNRNRQNSNN